MSKLSFWAKLGILFKVSFSSGLFVIILLGLIGLGFLFFMTDKKTLKRNKTIYLVVSCFVILFLLIAYHKSLGNMFDYLMNNLFVAVYFPNLAIYFAAIIIMNIILWISLFSFKSGEIIKKVNVVVYVIMNYLLALILSVIKNDNLDVFSQSSVYGNEKATALIELSSSIFIIWIIFLILYKIILIYLRKDYKPKVKKVIVRKKVKMLPENFEATIIPEMVYQKRTNKPVLPKESPASIIKVLDPEEEIEKYSKNVVNNRLQEEVIEIPTNISDLYNVPKNSYTSIYAEDDYTPEVRVEEKPHKVVKEVYVEKPQEVVQKKIVRDEEQKVVDAIEQTLTIDDYKLLVKMLKEQKEKERLEQIRLEERRREQNKFSELQQLYQSVR